MHGAALRATYVYRFRKLHVPDPVGKCVQSDRLLVAYRADELVFYTPGTAFVFGNVNAMQRAVASLSTTQTFPALLETQCPFATEQPYFGGKHEASDRAHVHVPERPIRQIHNNFEVVGHVDGARNSSCSIASIRHRDTRARRHRSGVSHPTHDAFVIDPKR